MIKIENLGIKGQCIITLTVDDIGPVILALEKGGKKGMAADIIWIASHDGQASVIIERDGND